MSKKMLKFAGQRRTWLALIMATVTLGLLFAGWLTPTRSKADNGGPNPPPNQENTPNCPNYTYTTNTSCPSVTNYGTLGPMSFCMDKGSAVPYPSLIIPPGATTGNEIVTTTETCSNTVTYSTNNVTYGFVLTNGAGAPTSNSPAGSYSADFYYYATSSDSNSCSPPANYDYGNVTWQINKGIDAGSYQGATWSPESEWKQGINDIAANIGVNIFDLSDPQTVLYLSHNYWNKQYCCTNGSSGNLKKVWEKGIVTPYHLQGSFDFNLMSLYPSWIQSICDFLAANDTNSASQLSTIKGLGEFSAGASTTVSANTTIQTLFQDDCYGCNDSPFTTGTCNFNANINDQFNSSLINTVVSITGYFSSVLNTYGLAITPPTPANQMNIYTQDYITYSLTAFVQIGTVYTDTEPYIPSGAKHVPATPLLVTTVCTSPNY